MVNIHNKSKEGSVTKHIMSKLVADPNRGRGVVNHGDGNYSPSMSTINEMTRRIGQNQADAENIFATLPDTELAMLILVSSIISPNEMRDAEFTWNATAPQLSPDLIWRLMEIIRSHFEDDYQLKKMLPEALKDALFKTGSYPIAVISESAIDDVINGRATATALESYKQELSSGTLNSIGILGPNNKELAKMTGSSRRVGIESIFGGAPATNVSSPVVDKTIGDQSLPVVTITDNPEVLKLSSLAERHARDSVLNVLSNRAMSNMRRHNGMESFFNTGNFPGHTVVQRNYGTKQMVRLNTAENSTRAPLGHPLSTKLPSAIVPVHVPSNPSDHLGYIVPLDAMGNFLDFATDSLYYEQLQAMSVSASAGESSRVLARSRMLQESLTTMGQDTAFNELYASYSAMLEQDITERLRNGVYGGSAEIKRIDEFYRMMMARTFSGQHTQLLYLPAEMVTYIAFDYDQYGIGRSLLDKSKILAGIRSTLLFANTMAAIKNSVPRRNLNITIPEEDLEPEKTVELAMGEFARVNTAGFPVATTAPRDIMDGLRNASVSVNVTGNPNFPEIGVAVEDVQSSRALVDNELDENMKKSHMQVFGLTMDQIDSTANIEFAVTQLNSSLMYTRRISMYQETTHHFLKDHVIKYTYNSGKLLSDMIMEIRKYREEINRQKEQSEKEKMPAEQGNANVAGQQYSIPPGPDTRLDYNPEQEESPEMVGEPMGEGSEEPESPYSVKELHGTVKDKAIEEGVLPDSEDKEFAEMSEREVIDAFMDGLSVTLPPPDSTRLSNQLELYNEYSAGLDAFLVPYLNEEVLEMTMGEDGRENAGKVIQIVKNFFQRQFMAQNNIMPELQILASYNDDTENALDLLEVHELHKEGIAATIGLLLQKLSMRHPNNDSDGGYDTSYGSDNVEDDDLGGMGDLPDFDEEMDLGLGEETGGDEPPAEEEPAEETPAEETQTEPEPEPEVPAEEEPDVPEEPQA